VPRARYAAEGMCRGGREDEELVSVSEYFEVAQSSSRAAIGPDYKSVGLTMKVKGGARVGLQY
jgi:hypothetical protein